MPDLDPTCCLSNMPAEDGVLISRRELRQWLTRVQSATTRLQLRQIGISTEGRPIDAAFIAEDVSSECLDDLLDSRRGAVNALLRGSNPMRWHKPIVLVTSGIHATEVGGPQSLPELIHWLVFDDAPEVRALRERVLTIIVPTLNPDGMDMVQRWHDATNGTSRAGSLPPLLYHRHAGHDNNRDWLFRNLPETRAVLDAIHRPFLPHVTLDQHQMNPQGPRFALQPYADPWEPHVHPHIVAAANGLGQAIATEMTLSGQSGVTTGRYFDAWEPSRAIQHYRGGVRILAEAASANLAHPITVTEEQLAAPPLPQERVPTTDTPLPWAGGTWRLRDIVDYHLAAAKSLLLHVSRAPERWLDLQHRVLTDTLAPDVTVHVPTRRPAIDLAANRRLAAMLADADVATEDAETGEISSSLSSPLGRMATALLLPKPYPEALGSGSYDVTTHHLPAITGAVVTTDRSASQPVATIGAGEWLAVDARSHRAPELIEAAIAAGPGNIFRAPRRALHGTLLTEPGTWLVARSAVPEPLHPLAHTAVDHPPDSAMPVARRDLVLLGIGDQPTADHGWTRWWLEARAMPYLEADTSLLGALEDVAGTTTLLVADTPVAALAGDAARPIARFVAGGGHVLAFGRAGLSLAASLSTGVETVEFPTGSAVHAPGALLRLLTTRNHRIALGLDRAIPAMFQRDGIFRITRRARSATVLGRFGERDTVVSGWMSDPSAVRDSPAVVEIHHGTGMLHAFAFRPLFRGQMLVTAPLVHNLIYTMELPT